MYKNLVLTAMYHKNADYFYGEQLFTSEEIHYIGAQYRIKKVNLGLMLINPFSKEYKRTEDFRNQYARFGQPLLGTFPSVVTTRARTSA